MATFNIVIQTQVNQAVEYIYSFDVNGAVVSKADLKAANKWEGTLKTAQPEYSCQYGPAGCADPKYVTKK